MKEENAEDIDYLHPHGKPVTIERKKSQEELARDLQQTQKSIDEADGHHMCSDQCQKHHKI